MKAMRLHAINDFRLEEVEKPQPRGKEILHVHDENSYCPLPPLAGEVAPQGRKG